MAAVLTPLEALARRSHMDCLLTVADEFTISPEGGSDTPNVLTNDSDIDGDALIAQLVSGPAHGTLSLNVDGTFTYTPAEGFEGDDSFTIVSLWRREHLAGSQVICEQNSSQKQTGCRAASSSETRPHQSARARR